VKNKYLFILIVLLISVLSFYRLVRPGYFSMQDDVQILRLRQMDKCFEDRQIPCRYTPDEGLGYGYPLFNFYPPFPYILGELFHLMGFSFIESIKIVFILGFALAGLGMFLWAKLFWGDWGGLVSSVFYIFVPYRALDGYVRGALGEFWGLTLFPYLFLFLTLAVFKRKNFWWFFFSLTFCLLLLTHILSSVVVIPLLVIYFLFLITKEKQKKKSIFIFLFSLLLAILMSAFFVLPMAVESRLTTIKTMTEGYFDFRAHFTTLNQLFLSRFWGYGASLFGPVDDMSFQIGILHWLIPLVAIFFLFIKRKNYISVKNKEFFVIFVLLGFLAAFLTHNKSTFIWELIKPMKYFQFPWRFLMVVAFCFSFSAGFLITLINGKKIKIIISLLLILTAIIFNIGYFKEDIWFSKITDEEKLTGSELIKQSGAGIRDYWPIYGQTYPKNFSFNKPLFLSGLGKIKEFSKNSNSAEGNLVVETEKAQVVFPIVFFPNWQLFINGKIANYELDKELGLIKAEFPKGEAKFILKFYNTPVRRLGNLVSLLTFMGIFISFAKRRMEST